jgi:hypothetical protein
MHRFLGGALHKKPPADLYAVHGIENIHMLKADILIYFVSQGFKCALQRGKIHIAGGGINKHHHGKIILHGGLAYIEYVYIKLGKLSGHLSYNAYSVFAYYCNDRFHKNVMPCGILSMGIFFNCCINNLIRRPAGVRMLLSNRDMTI